MLSKWLLGLLTLLALTACQFKSQVAMDKEWVYYKAKFVDQSGRVIDTGNNGISHSEGQGYGLLLSIRNDDQESFEKIWHWAKQNLQVRDDNLFIWRRRPNFDLKDEDMNNATDGDIIIAWALLEAAQKWQEDEYKDEALKIMADIKHKLVVPWNNLEVLLPGMLGFKHEKSVEVNLSYWIFPAFALFKHYDNDPIWARLESNGLLLLRKARFGQWQLPPDWLGLEYDNKVQAVKNQRFSYDAIRIPLYLIWGGYRDKEILQPFVKYWSFYSSYTPSWIALNEQVMDTVDANIGIKAVKHLTFLQQGQISNANFAILSEQDGDYYQATLLLLSKLCYQQIKN